MIEAFPTLYTKCVLASDYDALLARCERAETALQSIAEYWNGGNNSAVDAVEVMTQRAAEALAPHNDEGSK
jgi:hypothetical protein